MIGQPSSSRTRGSSSRMSPKPILQAQLRQLPPQRRGHPARQLVLVDRARRTRAGRPTGRPSRRASRRKYARQLVQRRVVEQRTSKPASRRFGERLLGGRLRGAVGQRPHCGADERRSESRLLRGTRRGPSSRSCASAPRAGSSGAARADAGTSVRTRSGVSRPPGSLRLSTSTSGLRCDRAGALCVVVVGVERADREHEAGDDLFRAAPLRDRRDLQIGRDVVHRLGDPDAPDPVADHAGRVRAPSPPRARATRP